LALKFYSEWGQLPSGSCGGKYNVLDLATTAAADGDIKTHLRGQNMFFDVGPFDSNGTTIALANKSTAKKVNETERLVGFSFTRVGELLRPLDGKNLEPEQLIPAILEGLREKLQDELTQMAKWAGPDVTEVKGRMLFCLYEVGVGYQFAELAHDFFIRPFDIYKLSGTRNQYHAGDVDADGKYARILTLGISSSKINVECLISARNSLIVPTEIVLYNPFDEIKKRINDMYPTTGVRALYPPMKPAMKLADEFFLI